MVALVSLGDRLCHRYGLGSDKEDLDVLANGLGDMIPLEDEDFARLEASLELIRDLAGQLSQG